VTHVKPPGMQTMLRSVVLLSVMSGCAVDDTGPATAGSPSAQAAQEAAEIAKEAKALEALARELTSEMDGARQRVVQGERTPEAEAKALQAKMAEVSKRHDALQERIQAWEKGLHEQSGDVTWPQEPVKGKR